MKIAFFASPEFALPVYQRLRASLHTMVAVVTRPDVQRGRGLTPRPTVIKKVALDDGLPVFTPERLNIEFLDELSKLEPDVLVVVAYGRMIGPTALARWPGRVINLHPSLLPAYRGPSPIQTAILDGLEETGVSIMHLVDEMDAGDVIMQRPVPILPGEQAASLHDRLALAGGDLLVDVLDRLAIGTATRTPQDPTLATFTRKLEKEDGRIDWTQSALIIGRRVRAFHAWPGAFSALGEEMIRLHRVEPVDISAGKAVPGEIFSLADDILVACGEGVLAIRELQPPTRKVMSAAAFLRGRSLVIGTQFA